MVQTTTSFSAALVAGLFLHSAFAVVTPTAPGPGASFSEGSQCSFEWNADTTGKWTSFDVDLMSGSNQDMSVVTRVESGLDGSKSGTKSFACPDVTPNSAIYFYQFTQNGADPQWTTRFTIASASGQVTAPEHATQSDGSAIPWGVGSLAAAAGGSTNSSSSSTRAGRTTATSSTATTTSALATSITSMTTITTTSSTSSSTTTTESSSTSSPSPSASASATPASGAVSALSSLGPIAAFFGTGIASLALLL